MLNTLFVQIKIKGFSKAVPESTNMRNKAEAAEVKSIMPSRTEVFSGCDLLAVASSTGGPHALEELLTKLPQDFPAPVLVVQHMPPDFTRVLADSLNKRCELDVAEGYDSQALERGKVIIAPGGFHMVVGEGDDSKKAIKLIGTPPVNGIRPSADVLFASIAGAYKDKKILSVILTGMGNDGTKGIKEIKKLCRMLLYNSE